MSRIIPDDARARQQLASDPAVSAFVSANAGSGKTHVLVQRVVRLLLNGVAPERILCITFTKAAAANMAERVFTTLGRWIALDDAGLDAAIREAGATPSPRLRRRARALFAEALDTPGGLKVQTIHALCTRLLQQFPFEAEVPAHFAVLDDRDQAEMLERASLDVLLKAAADPHGRTGRSLAVAMAEAADVTFRDVVREACLARERLVGDDGLEAALARLARALGIAPDLDIATLEREIVEGPYLPLSQWEAAARVFDTGSSNDQKQAARLRAALAENDAARVDAYLDLFGREDKGVFVARKSLLTKATAERHPALAQALADEQPRVLALRESRCAVKLRERTAALMTISGEVIDAYRRDKLARGLIDYDDLIDKALKMLDRVASGWVHYKLDRGIDHVLIDEAQDTSPQQWDIVERLIAEFTSGAGARDGVKRTVFAVGDEKQSIFSFQGAAPREFDARRRALMKRFREAGQRFEQVAFTYSFRSGPAILQSVDGVFADEMIYRSIHAVENNAPIHQALADAAPGMVELWEPEEKDARPDIEGWRAPFDATPETSPEVKLARRIARSVTALIDAGTPTGPAGRQRRLAVGDVLVLVRRRGRVFDAVIQALKRAGIPVAGADRLKLTQHIAVIDLMNLADALLLRQDDLALAVALKSPLFGLDDDDLIALAASRKGTLRDALAAQASAVPRYAEAVRRLEACAEVAARETPFGFFAWLLGSDGGRGRILRRLGPEANDALDEFLELALGYERRAPASLQGFLAWLRAADTEVKRDMELGRDEVRVMTVHGAKGLEAPVVILADTTTSPADHQRGGLIRLPGASHEMPCVVWAASRADDPPAVAAARAAIVQDTEDEYRRLLYVAMTRAADRLIVGGSLAANRNDVREASWYDLIRKGLSRSDLTETVVETDDGPVRRYARAGAADTMPLPAEAEGGAAVSDLPPWLSVPAAAVASDVAPLQPSHAGPARARRAGTADEAARQRGTLAHRLLQSLPDVAASERRIKAQAFLARHARDWDEGLRQVLVDEVVALIADPRFAALFAEGSRAEVPIVGRLAHKGLPPLRVHGQIDRLAMTSDGVLIADYKTDRVPPRAAAAIPDAYVRQLALYRAVLQKLHPGRPVRASVVFTATPEIFEIEAARLDAALAGMS
ncbi:MAG: double-strand break repair helicase AddA [Proteobacteria bacterium]|nr:MAG: double-strand break repair helicase AddA [Pseudomonadota bacterium]